MSRIFSSSQVAYDTLEQDIELQIALSQILYGCVPHATDEGCVMIFKDKPEKIVALVETKEISTRFSTVEKEEFPSVAIDIEITTGRNLKLKYEYFFLTESSEETFFLATLAKSGVYSLLFLCDEMRHAVTVEMDKDEMEPLNGIISSIGDV